MEEELQQRLYIQFPHIFAQAINTQEVNAHIPLSSMIFGLSIDKGWFTIVENLCLKLSAIRQATGIDITTDQVKEKFGTLRFYVSVNSDNITVENKEIWWKLIYSLISDAEHQSSYTCERCGYSPAKSRNTRWIKTLCDKCYAVVPASRKRVVKKKKP